VGERHPGSTVRLELLVRVVDIRPLQHRSWPHAGGAGVHQPGLPETKRLKGPHKNHFFFLFSGCNEILEESFIGFYKSLRIAIAVLQGVIKMETLDTLLAVLRDGAWHDLNELSTKPGLRRISMTALELSATLFAKYGFIEQRETWKGDPDSGEWILPVTEVKINPRTKAFLEAIERVEKAS